MALPYGTTGSLSPTFVPARLVGLTVKHPYAFALYARLPSVLRVPLKASVTLLEATTPVKLPTKHCRRFNRIRLQINKGWYFNVDSTQASAQASLSPTYPTHRLFKVNVKL
jgi:hypothetical protein